jgi:hypothetical protein
MTATQWKTGREKAGLTQVVAARALNVSQPYLSQLETGLRVACSPASQSGSYPMPRDETTQPSPDARPVSQCASRAGRESRRGRLDLAAGLAALKGQ